MARQTLATLTARVGIVSRALGLPLHHHAGPEGFAVGALWLINQDHRWTLFQISNNAGAKEQLTRGTSADVVAFLDGMISAANVVAFAKRYGR